MDTHLFFSGGDFMWFPSESMQFHLSIMDDEDITELGSIAHRILSGDECPARFHFVGNRVYDGDLPTVAGVEIQWDEFVDGCRLVLTAGAVNISVDATREDLEWLAVRCEDLDKLTGEFDEYCEKNLKGVMI